MIKIRKKRPNSITKSNNISQKKFEASKEQLGSRWGRFFGVVSESFCLDWLIISDILFTFAAKKEGNMMLEFNEVLVEGEPQTLSLMAKAGEITCLTLKEHEAARWLSKNQLDSIDWLPADKIVVEKK